MLLLSAAPHSVQMMVRADETAASAAIEAVREHGDKAAAVLDSEKKTVAAAGGKKITTAAPRQWSPPPRAVLPMVSAVNAVAQAIPEHVRQALQDKLADDHVIELPTTAVNELLAQQAAIRALRDKA